VPPGCVFAMGDNRDRFARQRYWGFVPRRNIEGTPLVIYWSFEAPTADLTNGNIGVGPHHGHPDPLLHQDTLVAHAEAGPRLSSEVKRSGCRRRSRPAGKPAFDRRSRGRGETL